MDELLGYVFGWILSKSVPALRAALGNWGCFIVSVLAAGVLVWFVPAYVLGWSGGSWKTWLIVGPLATVALVVMVTATFGLAKGSRGRSHEQAGQHLDRAYAHAERGEFKEALSECAAALHFDPGYAEAHNLRGIVLEELGHTAEAIAAYHRAVRLDPAFSEARENLSEVEAELSRGTA